MKSTKICLCGKINDADAKFCIKCGQKLDLSLSELSLSELTEQHLTEIKKAEDEILKYKYFSCKVGHIHQGLSSFGLWGTLNNGSMKFKSTRIKLHDDKFIIERSMRVVEFNDIKEIFMERLTDAVIITYSGDNVVLQAGYNQYTLLAFKNLLSKLIEENKLKSEDIPTKDNSMENSEDDLDRLLELGKMYEKGLLTDEEFAAMKKKIIEN